MSVETLVNLALSPSDRKAGVVALLGARILVVEDDRDLLAAYVMLLRLEGVHVTQAATGQEALRQSRAGVFDVLLTDLGLPDIPGQILIRAIRAAAHGRLGVLVVTGAPEQARAQAYEAGADVVLTKPVEWEAVLGSLARLTSSRAA